MTIESQEDFNSKQKKGKQSRCTELKNQLNYNVISLRPRKITTKLDFCYSGYTYITTVIAKYIILGYIEKPYLCVRFSIKNT